MMNNIEKGIKRYRRKFAVFPSMGKGIKTTLVIKASIVRKLLCGHPVTHKMINYNPYGYTEYSYNKIRNFKFYGF
jgi:hypothetical protein